MHDMGRVMTRALLAATLFLFAGSAYAADMPVKAPAAPPPAPTWTGWYIGINGGGGWGHGFGGGHGGFGGGHGGFGGHGR